MPSTYVRDLPNVPGAPLTAWYSIEGVGGDATVTLLYLATVAP